MRAASQSALNFPLGRTLREHAEGCDLFRACHLELFARNALELLEIPDQRRLEARRDSRSVAVRATQGLFEDFVDEAELVETIRREIERLGGRFFLVLALPENRSATFGR